MNIDVITHGFILSQKGVWAIEHLLDDEIVPIIEWLYFCMLTDSVVLSLDGLTEALTDGVTLHAELEDLYERTHIVEVMETMVEHYYPPTYLPWGVTDFTINGSVSLRLPGTLLLTYSADTNSFKRLTEGP